MRIQLAGATSEAGDWQMVEVNGKKIDDGVAREDSKRKGTLSIIDAEIYE